MNRIMRGGALVIALLFFMHSLLPARAAGGYPPDEAYHAIDIKIIKAHLSFLASNLLEGREATTRGYDIAAGYAASLFQQYGLKPMVETQGEPSFQQVFPVIEIIGKSNDSLQVQTQRGDSYATQDYNNRVHFLIGNVNQSYSFTAPVVFAGYGLVEKEANYDDYATIDVKNKIVVVMAHAPGEGDEKSYFYQTENRGRFFQGSEVFVKQRNAQSRGALALLIVSDPLGKHQPIFNNYAGNVIRKPRNNVNAPTPRRRMVLPDVVVENPPIPIINISDSVAATLLGSGNNLEAIQRQINTKQQPNSFELTGKRVKISAEVDSRLLNTTNIIGMLEGSDPVLKNEYVIIGAHLDHDGIRDGYIWNGADDDASGSSAVIVLAEAFSRAKSRPKRSILFCLWGAEEKGLLGSKYFTNHPPVPLENIAAMVQLDMIGRDVAPRPHQLKEGQTAPKDLLRYVYTEISSRAPEIGEILLRANETVGLELNHEVNDRVNGGSDHFSFWLKHIPVLSIDDGVYHDDYHQPGDTVDKINFDKVLLVSRLTYLVAREVANQPTRLKWTEPPPPSETAAPATPTKPAPKPKTEKSKG